LTHKRHWRVEIPQRSSPPPHAGVLSSIDREWAELIGNGPTAARLDSEHFKSDPRTCRLPVAGESPMFEIRRREFITLLGGAAAWPLAAHAQRQGATPAVGFLRDSAAAEVGFLVDGLHKGLAEAGFVEGHNLTIDYAWSEGQSVRLSTLAAELVGVTRPSSSAVRPTRRSRPRPRPPRSPSYSRSTTIP
jgi:hypothetical protein